jgi:3-oxoacyl-[acyl-carrier protein] reductase
MTDDKVMLITGTSKGIGKYLAEYYSKKKFEVVGCSRRPVNFHLKNYQHFCLDVADERKVKEMFFEVRKKFGRLDILINNAGIASMNHSLLTPLKIARKILDTNVIGNFLFSRESAKLMRKNRYGRIVNFATFAIPFKLEGEAIYAASKAAIVTLTEVLCREYADYGITVNAVAPPAVKTDLILGVPEDKMEKLLLRQAIHKYGDPLDVCNVINFFIKPENGMVTGQIVYLGGV